MSTHVDANVVIDILTDDPVWCDWSREKLMAAAPSGLVCNAAAYAEASIGFSRHEQFADAMRALDIRMKPTPPIALFVAGKAHLAYRRRGGAKVATLPDFFIGAHASTDGAPLLTRDPKRFRAYFPDLDVIAP